MRTIPAVRAKTRPNRIRKGNITSEAGAAAARDLGVTLKGLSRWKRPVRVFMSTCIFKRLKRSLIMKFFQPPCNRTELAMFRQNKAKNKWRKTWDQSPGENLPNTG